VCVTGFRVVDLPIKMRSDVLSAVSIKVEFVACGSV
jgi:hypothetical protein